MLTLRSAIVDFRPNSIVAAGFDNGADETNRALEFLRLAVRATDDDGHFATIDVFWQVTTRVHEAFHAELVHANNSSDRIARTNPLAGLAVELYEYSIQGRNNSMLLQIDFCDGHLSLS